MQARMRRLQADYNRIMDDFCGHNHVRIEPVEGNPPRRYIVTFYLTGLKWDQKRKCPVECYEHQVEIYLHKDYPREKPQLKMKSEIFHPNFSGRVCIADHWAAGESLSDIIVQIGQMIQYQNYNPKSPLNQVAARWAMENEKIFPLGHLDLYQPEPDVILNQGTAESTRSDVDIDLL